MKAHKNLSKLIILFFLFAGCMSPKPTNDLQLTLEIQAEDKKITQEDVDKIQAILLERLDNYGIPKKNIKLEIINNRIVIEIKQIDDPERIKRLLTTPGKLEFWETYDNADSEIYQFLFSANEKIKELPGMEDSTANRPPKSSDTLEAEQEESVMSLLNQLEAQEPEIENSENTENLQDEYPLFAILQPNLSSDYHLQSGSVIGYSNKKDMDKINEYLAIAEVSILFPRNIRFLWSVNPVRDANNRETDIYELHAIKVTGFDGSAPLGGDFITRAVTAFSRHNDEPVVRINMNNESALIWRRLTSNNIGNYIAVVVDDKVCTSARVAGEIEGGKTEISGGFTTEEARDLANILNSSVLPCRLEVISEQISIKK